MTLVESLRKYVGEQVPPEAPSQTWELERQELLDTLKVGEKTPGDQGMAWKERAKPLEGKPCCPRDCPRPEGSMGSLADGLLSPALEGGPG